MNDDAASPGPAETGRPEIRFGLPSPGVHPPTFGRSGTLSGLAIIAVVIAWMLWAGVSGRPAADQRPSLFGGSLVLEDARPLTVINVATAQITVRLQGVDAQVGAQSYGDVQPVAVQDGTVLVNRRTGAFNFLGRDDYVTDPGGPGVGLGPLAGLSGAEGVASGADAYIVRSAPRSTVSLVGRSTVVAAARSTGGAVTPLGFASLPGTVGLGPGGTVVSGSDLWALVTSASSCQMDRLAPSADGHGTLAVTSPWKWSGPCTRGAVEAVGATTALAVPGTVRLFGAGRPAHGLTVATPATGDATRLVPVRGGGGSELWFFADRPTGWTLVGIDSRTGRASNPYPLSGFGAGADPTEPVFSSGFLYTLDQARSPQPTLWTIDPANGHMAPVSGAATYPLKSSAERNSFDGAQVISDGPRVVFNNPQNLEAVVVFTDGSHPPVVVDKSSAVTVSTTGAADLDLTAGGSPPGGTSPSGPTGGSSRSDLAVPVAQPVSQKVTCANTTQKPYAPQITAVTPSSATALVSWSYELLDQTDCEPSSWSVQVTALSGSHQPSDPLQVVYGQNQYLFHGLRPATPYSVVVTAYINTQSTPSTPATFTTAARGPDAPLSVTTTADGHGNWVVSWTPCTEAARPDCVVPADQWTVTGSACGGAYAGTPPSVSVAGDTDTVSIDAASLGLLGESLSFDVQGSLASGLTGNPTGDGSCTRAWSQPDPTNISLAGAGAASGSTITATLQVSATGDPVTDFGGLPADTEFVYSIAGKTIGPTTSLRVEVPRLPAGTPYTPSVAIYPAGHPEAAVTVTGAPFSQNLPWPADLQSASSVASAVGSVPNSGTVTVTFPPDLLADPLTATGVAITCGSTAVPEADQTVSGGHLAFLMDLVDSGGACSISFTLHDNSNPDPFGGPSPQLSLPFRIGTEPTYTFSATISQGCQANFVCGLGGQPYQVVVNSTGTGSLSAGGDWTVSSAGPLDHGPVQLCSTNQGLPGPDFPFTFQLPPQCPDPSTVQVTVSYKYLGQIVAIPAGTAQGAGSPPTSVPSSPPTTTPPTTTPPTTRPPTTTPPTTTPPTTTPPTTTKPTTTTKAGTTKVTGTAEKGYS